MAGFVSAIETAPAELGAVWSTITVPLAADVPAFETLSSTRIR